MKQRLNGSEKPSSTPIMVFVTLSVPEKQRNI